MRHYSCWPSGLMLVLAVGGLPPAARTWAHRALDELRQPAPDRLALCILRI